MTPFLSPAAASNVLVGPGMISTMTVPSTNSAALEIESMNWRIVRLEQYAFYHTQIEDPEKKRAVSAGTPMPLGGPYEPAAAAEFLGWLASGKNGHMTGQTIFIDGGADVVIRGDSVW